MAFVHSATGLCSSFTRGALPKVQTCSTSATTKMSVSEGLVTLLKGAVVAGAVTIGTLAIMPEDAEAAFLKFPGKRPSNIGLRYGRYLSGCPPSPNCVSSMENVYDKHFVPAWTYNNGNGEKKTMAEAIKDVTKVIEDTPRTKIIESKPTTSEVGEGHYIYAEYESKTFGFVDDVEFFFQPDNETVEYRSASRLGEGDFDANRNRIRDIRRALQDMDKRWASVGY